MNTTSVGMHPAEDQSPVAASALAHFSVVFDAIYTPLETQLLKVGGLSHMRRLAAELVIPHSCVTLRVRTMRFRHLAVTRSVWHTAAGCEGGGVHADQRPRDVCRAGRRPV